MDLDTEEYVGKVPIRGWLVLLGILVWGAPFAYLLVAVVGSFIGPPLAVIESLISLVFSVLILTMFVRRKRLFVLWELIYLTYGVVLDGINVIANRHSASGLFIGVAELVVIGLYLFRSSRVKRTFVR